MYEYYTAYKKAHTSGDLDTASKFSNQLRWEIARHAVGEEIVVYPLMEEHMGAKGKELADHDRQEHTEVKQMLQELDALEIAASDYNGKMEKLMEHLKHHNDDEERDDLPQLEPKLGKDGSIDAAQRFTRTKKFVPTRTHPALPNQPPYETLAGFLVAPIDKLQDYFLSWPSSEQKEEAEKAYEQGGGRKQLDV